MRQLMINVLCILAMPCLGVMYQSDRQALIEAQQAAVAAAEQIQVHQTQLGELNSQVASLVAESDRLKATGVRDHKVKFPDLVERPSPGVLTFGELGQAPRELAVQANGAAMPPELAALDGQTRTISGFLLISFPADTITEAVLARNPWDECCLGVPPTLFDSVLVHMAPDTPLRYSRIRIGTFTGTVRVQPVYEGGELSRLFVLENARETASPVTNTPAIEQANERLARRGPLYLWGMPAVLVVGLLNNVLGGRGRPAPPSPTATQPSAAQRYSVDN